MDFTQGWLGIQAADKAYGKLQHRFSEFRIVGDADIANYEHPWRYTKRLNGGKHIPTWYQETGDCVSMGAAVAGDYLTAIAICRGGANLAFKRWFPPYIYGVSRTAPECGNGQLGWRAGSLGSWAIVGMQKYGVLFEDDPNVPAYSGALANNWGTRGVPREFYEEASDNLVRTAARINTVDELREAILNGCTATIASSWGFTTQVIDNCVTYIPRGSWAHQMSIIAYQDKPFPAFFRHNSHGPNSTPPPRNGEPPGGAWYRVEDLERELRTGIELYVLSAFDGFKVKGFSTI